MTIVGELSNVSTPASGHIYFDLKDPAATIPCAMWKPRAAKLKFRPANGLEVVVEATVDVYPAQGKVQLYVERITPRGEGALELAFRQLRESLAAEGLFDPARKKPIPTFPRAIGVVTSATGAAVRDIERTLARRWPLAQVYLFPAMVQGDGAALRIAGAVAALDRAAERLGIDTLIVGRGGGSLEDLWCFNEEPVARAIAACRIPVISGVGHEVDVTIADMVADLRAATPTAAAEHATPNRDELLAVVAGYGERMIRTLREQFSHRRQRLSGLATHAALRDPLWRIRTSAQRIDELDHRLGACVRRGLSGRERHLASLQTRLLRHHPARQLETRRRRCESVMMQLRWALGGQIARSGKQVGQLEKRMARHHPEHTHAVAKHHLAALERQLEAMSYQQVLARGYSVTRTAGGAIVHAPADAPAGATLLTELADKQSIRSVVDGEAATPPTAKPKAAPKPKPQKNKSKSKQSVDTTTLFDMMND